MNRLSFGFVDAESIRDLDQRFLRTAAFDHLVSHDVAVVRGPKGTGKSTLFEILTHFGPQARLAADGTLDNVLLVAGAGLLDTQEVVTEDIDALKREKGYDHERLWRLYVGIKVALSLAEHVGLSSGPVRELLKAAGAVKDRRLLPLLQLAWRRFISPNSPDNVTVGMFKAVLKVRTSKRPIDVTDLLSDAQNMLLQLGKTAWILFDKIDELYPGDKQERRRAIEGLMNTMMALRRVFPAIRITVFVRSDIWSELDFVNKTHLADKILDLKWTHQEIALLLVKLAAADPLVEAHVQSTVPDFSAAEAEGLSNSTIDKCLAVIFPSKVKFRSASHPFLSWFTTRIQDPNGTYPREAVFWANRAAEKERGVGHPDPDALQTSLISDQSLIGTYAVVSRARCEGYLPEFRDLREHFARFEGQTIHRFKRAQLAKLMHGLQPSETDMLRALEEVGVIMPVEGNVSVAAFFEVPLLYRRGLKLRTQDWI